MKKALGILLITLAIATTGIFSTLSAEAATANDQYTVLAPLPCIQGSGVTCPQGNLKPATQVNFKTYVQYIVNLAIALSAVTAVFMIVWGGFEYITSTIPGNKNDGKKRITNAVYGLILVLASYIILRTIDPRLVQIPTTLVAPLQLSSNLTKPTIQDFMGGLNTQASQLQGQKADAVANLNSAQNQINALQADQAALEKQINEAIGDANSPLSSPDLDVVCSDGQSYDSNVNELCAKRFNDIDQIGNTKNQAAVATAESTMLDKLMDATNNASGNTSDNNMAMLRNYKNEVDAAYTSAIQAMNANVGGPADSTVKQQLDDAHQFALGMLQLQADAINGPGTISTTLNQIQLGINELKVTALGQMVSTIPYASGAVNSIGDKIAVGSYQSSQQNAMANIVNTDVGPYANQIQDPTLRAYLIQSANNVVSSTGTAKSPSGK